MEAKCCIVSELQGLKVGQIGQSEPNVPPCTLDDSACTDIAVKNDFPSVYHDVGVHHGHEQVRREAASAGEV